MHRLLISAFSLLSPPLIARLLRHTYSLSLILLLLAGICFSQKPTLNPLNRMFFLPQSENTEAPLDSDGDGLPDEIEKSDYYPLETEFAWNQPSETDLFLPWQRFTIKSDYKAFPVTFPTATNLWNHVWISPAGYLSFGKPLNSATLQNYPLLGETNTLRRLIPQIAFCQGRTALIPELGSKFYATQNTFTFEKLFLNGSTNHFASIQATLHPDGRIGLAYKDIEGNLAHTHRIGWQMNDGGISLPTITNRTALILQPFTPTDPFNPDSDGDGLTDHEELFLYGSDPMNPTTAGDDLPDGWKVLHGLSPAIPYPPDTDTTCFADDWPATLPPISPKSIPIQLHVKTNRPAWFTITTESGATHRLPLQGSNAEHTIPFGLTADATLSIAPATTATGPWRYSIRTESLDPDCPILQLGDTTPRERGISTLERQGLEWITGGTALLSTPIETTPSGERIVAIHLLVTLQEPFVYCVLHDESEIRLPPPWPVGIAEKEWLDTGIFPRIGNEIVFTPKGMERGEHELSAVCYTTEAGYPLLIYPVAITLTSFGSANPLEFRAAARYPGHNPGDQLSGSEGTTTACGQCWVEESSILIVGFNHGIVNTRNLTPHPDETISSQAISHCVAVDYTRREIDLSQFLHETSKPHLAQFSWQVDGETIDNHHLLIREEPDDLYPEIKRIYLRNRSGSTIYDSLFLIVLNPETRPNFTGWGNRNQDISWVNALPFPPASLAQASDNTSSRYKSPTGWNSPAYFNQSYYHHLAYLDIRTSNTYNTHGHQACYDRNGQLIRSGVSAGSADWGEAATRAHREEDVKPFIRALQLDGNPIYPDNFTGLFTTGIPTRLTRPFIYEGFFTKEYLSLRPPHVQ